MLKLSRTWVLILSGLLMLASGSALLTKGSHYLSQAFMAFNETNSTLTTPLMRWLMPYFKTSFGSDSSLKACLIFLLIMSTLIGFLKGQMVMKKVVAKSVTHIESQGGRVPLFFLFPRKSLLIIALMMMLGMLFNKLGVPYDIRGSVDFAIGIALVRGGFFYFREIWMPKGSVAS